MQSVWRAPGRRVLRGSSGHAPFQAVAVVLFGLLLSGCVTNDGASRPSATSPVAFESIDGPPVAVFEQLVSRLDAEAEARNLPIVSRESSAPYRIRAYLAVGVEKAKKRSIVSWVWDVYDSEQQRRARFSGEEIVNRIGADGWAVADEAVLARIASSGMEQLAAYFRGADSPAPASEPEAAPVPSGPAVAGREGSGREAQDVRRDQRVSFSVTAVASTEFSSQTHVPAPRR